ncbi:MAG: hypothetical protein HQK97_10110 [Nitrospirae bacterium]|nr:hypothetical protein [Nitrospirota bacterium]
MAYNCDTNCFTVPKREAATEADLEIVKSALELKIESVRAEIEKSKAETLKWMFLFWAGQLVAIFAMLKAFMK